MGPERYFFEIAIYRVRRDRFDAEYETALKTHMAGHSYEPRRIQVEQLFWEEYGGPWRYNQVVGWVRLYCLGAQIRGELWLSSARRFQRRMAHHRIRDAGKAFELHVRANQCSADILAAIREELQAFMKSLRDGRLVLDLEAFENIAGHVDWKRLAGFDGRGAA